MFTLRPASLVLLFGLASLHAEQLDRPTPTVADFAYGKDSPRQVFDYWRAPSSVPTPVVVLIHGGGWIRGDKSQYHTNAIKPYLEAGISVVAVNYRYVQQAFELGVKPPVKAPMEDCARAVQTLRFHAREWGIDPRRIAASGGSAGACTSLWLAFHVDLADPGAADPVARQSTRLAAVAVNAPQTSLDPRQLREWMPNSNYGAHAFGYAAADGRWTAENFAVLLRHRDEIMDVVHEYSPYAHVTADDPPVYLWFPKEVGSPKVGEAQTDPTHSAVHGLQLAKALEQVGVEAVVAYPAVPDTKYGSMEAFLITKLKPAK